VPCTGDTRGFALAAASLDRRIPSIDALNAQLSAWKKNRNDAQEHVDWHFTTEHARGKLKRL